MQLTPTDSFRPARPAAPRPGPRLLARLDRPAAAGVIALAGWLVFVVARLADWADGRISFFIMSGTTYSHPALMVPAISHVHKKGYDGQFYYRFAFNPFNWHLTAYGITIDHPYRYTRIGYSVVAWIVSLGHGELLPAVLVLVNLACVAAMGWLGAVLARDAGRHALWGLLVAGYFGLVISVGRDTSEPLADALLLGGLLAYRRQRYWLAAALIGYAVFTNEPVLALPVALALARLFQMGRERRFRLGAPDLPWLLPALGYLVLQGIQRVVVSGTAGGVADASANLTLPFKALVPGVYRDVTRMSWTHLGLYDYNLIEFVVLGVFVVAGFLVLRTTTAPVHERVAFVCFVVLEMVIASGQFWDSIFGDGRTFVDAYVMAVVLLLATPAVGVSAVGGRGAHRAQASSGLTGKRLGGLAALAVAALVIVARRRILFM